MNNCFAFRLADSTEDKRTNLAIFCSSELEIDDLIKSIKNDIARLLIPKHIYILVRQPFQNSLEALLSDSSFKQEFDSLIEESVDKLTSIIVSGAGNFTYLANATPLNKELQTALQQQGMLTIFRNRKGLITSSSSYHFSKPSGDHCDKFIRASNLLISSTEATFLALSLLPHLQGAIKRIYIDTSSIAYLIALAIQISEKSPNTNIAIESFESYAVLNQPYDFVEDKNSLVVISATTSGSLAKKLMKKNRFPHDQMITLFHLGLPSDQIGLFDITPAVDGGITSTNEQVCKYCKSGAKLIRISGDQFLPETPKHVQLVIRKTDFSSTRKSFFKEFSKTNVLNWNQSSISSANSIEHFFIDVKNALDPLQINFIEDLDRASKRFVSRHVNAIISLGDTSSNALTEKIAGNEKNITILKPSELNDTKIANLHSVIVVAGAITSGRTLLSISRKLRSLEKSATITYFIGFSKIPTSEAFDQLKKDLTLGGHELFVLRSCPMPRIKEYTNTSWDVEGELLQSYSDENPFPSSDEILPPELASRLKQLNDHNLDSNSMFLPTPSGKILNLRRTFAFWTDLGLDAKTEQATQSDVYWTIQAVLHDLRLKNQEKGLASTYHTTLISPVCFDRFNDGVIQSCLLRAALPIELNYAIDDEFSRQMTDVIYSVLSNWQNDQGEASLEFLLSLASGRLRLIDKHMNELLLLKNDTMPDIMKFLIHLSSERSDKS